MSFIFSFQSPVQTFFGFESVDKIKELLTPYQNIGIVSGRTSIETTGMKSYLEDALHGKSLHFFSEVEENPSINTVIRGGSFMRSARCEVIIAFGGGSPLDAAKAIAAFATNHEGFYDLLAKAHLPHKPLPVLAIPSTCGTGSEMNAYSVITDVEKSDKINFTKPEMYPKWAILDPNMLKTLDDRVLTATVFDALSHALEGLISLRANPFSDMCAVTAMELILGTLARPDEMRSDPALANFLYASSMAGVVIAHTGTTLLHSLGYYLTNRKGVHHGTANAILMPYYMKMLGEQRVIKYAVIPSLFQKHGFDIELWLEKLGAGSLNTILNREEKREMIEYALTKPNVKYTPFRADADYIAKVLG